MVLIEKLMKTELVTAGPDDTVRDVVKRMDQNGVGAVLVVEGSGDSAKLRGLFSERDLLQRVVVPGLDPNATSVGSVMTSDPTAVAPEATVRECAELIRRRGFRHVPVVQGTRPVGILSARDFQAYLVAGLESLIENDSYRKALKDGRDPYDHIGGGYET
jgi:CBS domain-containing protein